MNFGGFGEKKHFPATPLLSLIVIRQSIGSRPRAETPVPGRPCRRRVSHRRAVPLLLLVAVVCRGDAVGTPGQSAVLAVGGRRVGGDLSPAAKTTTTTCAWRVRNLHRTATIDQL